MSTGACIARYRPAGHAADSGYSWAVAAATLALGSLSFGAVTSIPILFGPIARDFGWEHGRVAMVHTIAMACAGLGSIVIGRVLDRRGFFAIAVGAAFATGVGLVLVAHATTFWQMALAFGLLVGGVGQGAFFSPLAAAVSHWFDRHRAIAVAIALSGQSVGGLLIPPLLRLAAEDMGWRNALQAYGVLCCLGMLAAALLYAATPPAVQVAPSTRARAKGDPRESRVTLVLGTALFCSNGATFGIAGHMVAYGEFIGMGPATAGALMSVLFGVTLFSRLGVGAWLARGGIFRTMVAMQLVNMLGAWIVLGSSSQVSLFAGLLVTGLGFGGYLPAYGSFVRSMFPAHQAGRRLSELYLLAFFGAGAGTWLVGALRDFRDGQWDLAFTATAVLATIGPAILLARRNELLRMRTRTQQ